MNKWTSSYPTILAGLAQETPPNPFMTTPQRQSEEELEATSSILSQRQVSEGPPPLTPDSFDGNSGQPGAIPDDLLRSGYNQVRKHVT
jgi:hypothetical protein